jgi:hypothetical protein
MKNELAVQESQLAMRQEPSVPDMLQAMIEKGITSDNASAMTQLMALHERMQDRDAERQFNAAFVKLQKELPVIVAQSVIPNRGKYERFEDVMNVVGPLLVQNGFAVSFEQFADDRRIKVTCHLRHIAGHSSSTPFAVRLGGKADSETQADCKASTTAKRNSLLQALNIVIRQDCLQDEDDGRIEGGYITENEAIELEEWVEATNSDKVKFLEYAHAPNFREIHTSRLEMLQASLRAKEKRK